MCAAQDGVSVSKALEDALQSRDAELSQRPVFIGLAGSAHYILKPLWEKKFLCTGRRRP